MAEHHLIAFEIFLFQWIHERVSSLGNNETSGWATQTTTVQVGEGLLHIFVLNLFFFSFFFCNHHIDDSMDRYSYFIITHPSKCNLIPEALSSATWSHRTELPPSIFGVSPPAHTQSVMSSFCKLFHSNLQTSSRDRNSCCENVCKLSKLWSPQTIGALRTVEGVQRCATKFILGYPKPIFPTTIDLPDWTFCQFPTGTKSGI